jgi:hypothetical protein
MAMISRPATAFASNLINKATILIGAATLAALSATTAHAQNYPWCSQYTGSMGGSMNCGFSTYAQCMANVSGIGGFCIRNDTYQPPQGGARRSYR